MHAQQSPAERVAEIQAALRAAKLDGYDFRHSDAGSSSQAIIGPLPRMISFSLADP